MVCRLSEFACMLDRPLVTLAEGSGIEQPRQIVVLRQGQVSVPSLTESEIERITVAVEGFERACR